MAGILTPWCAHDAVAGILAKGTRAIISNRFAAVVMVAFGVAVMPMAANGTGRRLAEQEILNRTCNAARRTLRRYTLNNAEEVIDDMTAIYSADERLPYGAPRLPGLFSGTLGLDMDAFVDQYSTPRGPVVLRRFINDNCLNGNPPPQSVTKSQHEKLPAAVPVGHRGRFAGDVAVCPSLKEYKYLSGVDMQGVDKAVALGKAAGCFFAKAGTTALVVASVTKEGAYKEVRFGPPHRGTYWFEDDKGAFISPAA